MKKKASVRLVLLLMLGMLLVVALAAGGYLFYTSRSHKTINVPPALYANSLTQNQRAWQCEQGALCQFEANGLHILAPTDHLYFSELSGQHFSEQVIDVRASLD